jgi:hypothetical protein
VVTGYHLLIRNRKLRNQRKSNRRCFNLTPRSIQAKAMTPELILLRVFRDVSLAIFGVGVLWGSWASGANWQLAKKIILVGIAAGIVAMVLWFVIGALCG